VVGYFLSLIHWAPDEQWIINKNIFCMEKKHNPSKVDVTDGLFKNLAFRNMADLNVKIQFISLLDLLMIDYLAFVFHFVIILTNVKNQHG